ncbi:MAG: ATP-binding protein [Terriglobales bacterium]|jgi:two-component system, LuxR family, sensor kinase FixL
MKKPPPICAPPAKNLLSIYAPAKRTRLIVAAGFLIAAVAAVDWATKPYISLGFLYLFPIMILGGFLSRSQILVVALVCAVLQEAFSNLPENEAVVRLLFSSAGFVGTGLFISELIRNRRITMMHVEELEGQIKLREDAEEQLRSLVESSPAAIVTIDSGGNVLLANEAAQHLLASGGKPLRGQEIDSYLPALQTVLKTQQSQVFRTTLQCTGKRSDGEVFLAGVWFSTYGTLSGPRLAAIIVDLSEDLRNREDLSLDYLLKNTRILMSAVAHEIRNLCGAVLVVHKNLSRVKELESNEDFNALGNLIQSLERVSALELGSTTAQNGEVVELTSVLDEFRILIETAYHESKIEMHWDVQESLPLVWADRYGLIQVFLNLAKNSRRAMASTGVKQLRIAARKEEGTVTIRFEDTGTGIASPEHLFRPFQRGAESSGLGLYVSRAIMRSFGGELSYEPTSEGCCFAVVLPLRTLEEEAVDA